MTIICRFIENNPLKYSRICLRRNFVLIIYELIGLRVGVYKEAHGYLEWKSKVTYSLYGSLHLMFSKYLRMNLILI